MATINCWPHWSTRTVIIIRHRYRTIPSTIWWISDDRWFTFRYFARIPILLCSFICLQYIFVCLPNWFWFLLNINIKPQQKAADVIYTQNDISTISSFRLNKKKSNFFRNFIISSIQKWCNRIFSQQSQFRFVHSNFTYIVFFNFNLSFPKCVRNDCVYLFTFRLHHFLLLLLLRSRFYLSMRFDVWHASNLFISIYSLLKLRLVAPTNKKKLTKYCHQGRIVYECFDTQKL